MQVQGTKYESLKVCLIVYVYCVYSSVFYSTCVLSLLTNRSVFYSTCVLILLTGRCVFYNYMCTKFT